MDKKLKTLLAVLTMAILGLVAVPSAEALSIRLSSGAFTKTISDGDIIGPDVDADLTTVGSVTYIGSIGTWTVKVSSGLSDPVIGSATSPAMSLSIKAIASGTLPLTIWLSDDTFGPSGTAVRAAFGGTTAGAGTVTYTTYKDAGDAEFAETTLLTTETGFSPSFSGSASGSLATGAAPYSLTQKVTITRTSGLDATLSVPDGGSTAALLGSALFAFGMLRRRFGKS